jgi:hypothetical protein
VTLAGSACALWDWKTSAAMRWSIDPSMHLLVARNATITCDEVELAVLQPASDGDLWCDTSQASRGKKCLVGVVTSWQRALLARSQCWWPEFGDLRELIEGQELQRFEFKISRGG